MKASVIVPIYNAKTLLLPCLLTFKHQVLEDGDSFEVIVIDDGSSDGTGEAVAGLSVNYELTYMYKPRADNSSRSAARNKGIEAATGDVLIFADGDHLVPPHFIAEHLRFHKQSDTFAVIGLRQYLTQGAANAEELAFRFSKELFPPVQKSDERLRVVNQFSENFSNLEYAWYLFWTSNASVKKSHVIEIGGFDEDFIHWGLEDSEIGYRLHKKGLRFVYSRESTVYHQYHQGGNLEKLMKWSKNYKIFRSKHPDIEVQLLELLDTYQNHIKQNITLSWMELFTRVEYALRVLKGRIPAQSPVSVYRLTGRVGATTYDNIESDSSRKPLLIIDGSTDESVDIKIQMMKPQFDLMYYKVAH
jgi:glycosyltransferase involved in cell wall biosynthesis